MQNYSKRLFVPNVDFCHSSEIKTKPKNHGLHESGKTSPPLTSTAGCGDS